MNSSWDIENALILASFTDFAQVMERRF